MEAFTLLSSLSLIEAHDRVLDSNTNTNTITINEHPRLTYFSPTFVIACFCAHRSSAFSLHLCSFSLCFLYFYYTTCFA